MSRVFLTGGSGFIGGQLAVALLARGDEVVALARSEESARSLGSRGVEVARGDVLDRDTLVRAMAGCEIVHHVAGVNSHCPRDPGQLWRVNVVGPQNVVDAAVRQGVMRVVFTSSAASLSESLTGRSGTRAHRTAGRFCRFTSNPSTFVNGPPSLPPRQRGCRSSR
jgi:dihydroflavonol-4-reductase